MILPLLLLLQAAPAADAVTVIAQRLDRFRAQVAFGKAGSECRINDRVGCAAIEVCYPSFESRMAATSDRAIRPATRKVMRAALNDELRTCFTNQSKAGIDALAAQRAR
jgi:hypothetical protein